MLLGFEQGFGIVWSGPWSLGQVELEWGWWGIASTADIGWLTGCSLLHQIGGSGVSLVDGFSHFVHSHDPVLLGWDTCDMVTADGRPILTSWAKV